jgi:metallophosphoesterase superfamily enzyme
MVLFTDSFGYSTNDPAWIRTRFNPEVLREHFKNLDFNDKTAWANPEVFIIPAFNELCGGVPFNESTSEDLPGPAFSSGSIELDSAEIYLLDGTKLGTVKNLRKLDHTRTRLKKEGRPPKRPK